jgi:flavin reductase (DIM6/NTAB) family NADH-FMN oxidoreductase RutF
MDNQTIIIQDFSIKPYSLWNDQWFLLTSGDFIKQKFNCMTISWGSIGVIWNKPFVQVVVRPTRYTFEFMQAYPDFTICAFPEKYRKALQLLGAKSGRDTDKIAASGISPCKSSIINSPAYLEANLIIECQKMYADVFKPQAFIDPTIENTYPDKDYHAIYYGEILAITGDRNLYT